MKKTIALFTFFAALTLNVNATKHTITTSGLVYSPASLTVRMGDTVTISANNAHPLLQVSKATFNSNGGAALAGGFGPTTKNYTFTVTAADTIYYICTAHIDYAMKGKIIVAPASGIDASVTPAMDIALYPNPVTTTGTVRLTSDGKNPLSVQIYSINGQLLKDLTPGLTQQNGEYYVQFDATSLASGNHFVLATDGRKKVVRRFEVVR